MVGHTGAVPNTMVAMIAGWFRDCKSLLSGSALKIFVPYSEEVAALKRAPEYLEPKGPTGEEG